VAVPGWLPRKARKHDVLEGLSGLAALGAGGWGIIIPIQIAAEVALP